MLLVLCCFFIAEIRAQRIVIPRVNEPITFDGIVDEPFLNTLEPIPFVIHTPVFGKTERTDVWVVYNEEFIFVEARLFDRDHNSIMFTCGHLYL